MNRAIADEQVENQMIALSLLSKNQNMRDIIEQLEDGCREFRAMLNEKAPAITDMFAGLPRVKAMIIINAVALCESDGWKIIRDAILSGGGDNGFKL